jgi:perosamine synthetase
MLINTKMFNDIISFIRKLHKTDQFIPLHEPRFIGDEKQNLIDCIDSTFVSSVGEFVDRFEEQICEFTGSKYAIAVVNGTQALFVALHVAGAKRGTEVITQALTFVATPNAINYTGAEPVFIDVDKETLGLSPNALRSFLETHTFQKENKCWNKKTGKQIVACVPMHTFGHPCRIDEIHDICLEFNICLVEDSAESLGSYYKNKHTGLFGKLGILSFNGNKIITSGGGGMIITDDEELAKHCKHLTTTAKEPHAWEFIHDEIGFNFRMPNLNAALGVAQLKKLPEFIKNKRKTATAYIDFFKSIDIEPVQEPKGASSNYWLNAILFKTSEQRNKFLEYSNAEGVMTRCLWKPMNQLRMYRNCQCDSLENTEDLYNRVVNIPSSVRIK